MEDFDSSSVAEGSCPYSPPHPSPFPPPPPQFKYDTSAFSDYDMPYDENMDPMEPSAPPFEEDGSNIEPLNLTPSAPPMLEYDTADDYDGADAPIEGQEHQRRGVQLTDNAAQNHDREGDARPQLSSGALQGTPPAESPVMHENDERPPRYDA